MGIRRTVRARRISLLPLLAVAALIAGCGSSSGSSSSTGQTVTVTSAATTPTSSTPTTASTGTTAQPSTSSTKTSAPTTTSTSLSTRTSPPSPPAGASAVAACKRGVRALPHLKQSAIARLETICEKADSRDVNAKRKAAEEACRELVNASPLTGAAKERALAACTRAGK